MYHTHRTVCFAALSIVAFGAGHLIGADCKTGTCNNKCGLNNGFCTSATDGYYYSRNAATTICHKDGQAGNPDTEVNVSKTTIAGGSCAKDCTNDDTSSGSPNKGTSGTATVTTVGVNTICKS